MTTTLNIKSGIVIDHGSDWSDFRDWIDGTSGRLRHTWIDFGDSYMILALDGQITRVMQLSKSSPPSADQTDFESNYMNLSAVEQRTADGRLVVTQGPYAYTNENARFVGHLYTCTPGTTVHDELVTSTIRLQGGQYWASVPTAGDTVSFSIVDKDNILGNGPGVVLVDYVKNLPLAPWNHQVDVIAPTAGLVLGGLYFRVTYTNTGSNDVKFGVTYRWFEQPA